MKQNINYIRALKDAVSNKKEGRWATRRRDALCVTRRRDARCVTRRRDALCVTRQRDATPSNTCSRTYDTDKLVVIFLNLLIFENKISILKYNLR